MTKFPRNHRMQKDISRSLRARHMLKPKSNTTAIIAIRVDGDLPPEAVRELFCQCAAITGSDSRIAFSYIPTGSDGRPDVGRWTGLMLWLQKVVLENRGSGVYDLKNLVCSWKKLAGEIPRS